MTETKGDVGMLARLGENTEVCVGAYSTNACLKDHAYSDFLHLTNNSLWANVCSVNMC
jgi:hypothetical protein